MIHRWRKPFHVSSSSSSSAVTLFTVHVAFLHHVVIAVIPPTRIPPPTCFLLWTGCSGIRSLEDFRALCQANQAAPKNTWTDGGEQTLESLPATEPPSGKKTKDFQNKAPCPLAESTRRWHNLQEHSEVKVTQGSWKESPMVERHVVTTWSVLLLGAATGSLSLFSSFKNNPPLAKDLHFPNIKAQPSFL